jgi:uncharacterized protein (TIGR02453 family)
MDLTPLQHFLTELSFNNTKPWFDQNHSRYEALRLEFTTFMAEVIQGVAAFDESVAKVSAKSTLFRINRDVRFSNNKEPYKTSFSAAISPGGRNGQLPVYYLQFGKEDSLVAGGLYLPEPQTLQNIRAYIERFPKKADALLANKTLKIQRFPKGYSEASELLKYKSFTVMTTLADSQKLSATLAVKQFRAMQPLHAWLNDALSWRAS